MPQLNFCVPFCSPWRCVYQYTIALLFLWSPCGIPSVSQGTIHGLLTSRKSPCVFQFGIFKIFLWMNLGVFAFESSSSSCNSFLVLFIHSAFMLRFLHSYIFAPKLFCLSRIGMCVCLRTFFPYLLIEFSFIVLECFVYVVWLYLGILLIFLLLPVPSDLSPRVISFALVVLLFSFRPDIFWHFSSVLVCLLVVEAFLSVFPV